MTANDFTFFDRTSYFKELIRAAQAVSAGQRLAVATMSLYLTEPLVVQLMEALCDAAARGVQVLVAADAYNFLVNENTDAPGPLWYRPYLKEKLSEPFKSRLTFLDKLQHQGGRYVITNIPNKPFSVIPGGRSHIKAAVINDRLFIGGCNLESAKDIDIMVGIDNPPAADAVYTIIEDMVTLGSTKAVFNGEDRLLPIDDTTTLLIDAGTPRQSAIYHTALQLIDDAQEWIYLTCQYFPGGKTAQHLLAAYRRGVDVHIDYSHPRVQGRAAPAHQLYQARERLRLPAALFTHQMPKLAPKLHAKVLATDQAALFGSHNYVSAGVQLGTAEIACLRRDRLFAETIRHTLEQIIAEQSSPTI